MVFLLLDEPITIQTGFHEGEKRLAACEAAEEKVTTRVVSLAGEILPLEDGGFLMNVGLGFVIRFDANLKTQSRLLNKRIFVIDREGLGNLSVDEIKGKNYMDEHGMTKMQQQIDDIYAYLIKLSKGEK